MKSSGELVNIFENSTNCSSDKINATFLFKGLVKNKVHKALVIGVLLFLAHTSKYFILGICLGLRLSIPVFLNLF